MALANRLRESILGALLGGAAGDALGAAVEFETLTSIRRRFGPNGIEDFVPAYGRLGAITDDTQMTLFTAEGLLRAFNRERERGFCHTPSVVYHAYLRWLSTQGILVRRSDFGRDDGWLVKVNDLHARRAPGNTCLSALQSGEMGTVNAPINGSKGCGGIMRIAPVGMIGGDDAFRLGSEIAAITHGHPSGFLAAGAFARIVDRVLAGDSLDHAVRVAIGELATWPNHRECADALESALLLAQNGDPSPEKVEELGEGWVAEESLAISVYCALVARDFAHGVRLAVNHSGDSDSTGSLTGTLLGAIHGPRAIPTLWLLYLELRSVIEELGDDLYAFFRKENPPSLRNTVEKYPGS